MMGIPLVFCWRPFTAYAAKQFPEKLPLGPENFQFSRQYPSKNLK
jgi:hypothetical protein